MSDLIATISLNESKQLVSLLMNLPVPTGFVTFYAPLQNVVTFYAPIDRESDLQVFIDSKGNTISVILGTTFIFNGEIGLISKQNSIQVYSSYYVIDIGLNSKPGVIAMSANVT